MKKLKKCLETKIDVGFIDESELSEFEQMLIESGEWEKLSDIEWRYKGHANKRN